MPGKAAHRRAKHSRQPPAAARHRSADHRAGLPPRTGSLPAAPACPANSPQVTTSRHPWAELSSETGRARVWRHGRRRMARQDRRSTGRARHQSHTVPGTGGAAAEPPISSVPVLPSALHDSYLLTRITGVLYVALPPKCRFKFRLCLFIRAGCWHTGSGGTLSPRWRWSRLRVSRLERKPWQLCRPLNKSQGDCSLGGS